jgi:broad specificity phosphatase PhoE
VGHPPGVRTLTDVSPQGRELPIHQGLDASIVLLRHGESVFISENRFQGQFDTPLTPLGARQAALAAARLARPTDPPALPVPATLPIEIVHSPLSRAAATAMAVAAALDAGRTTSPAPGRRAAPAVRPEPGLSEIGQGEWEGLHRDEVEARYGAILAAWRSRPLEANAPGGERLVDAAVRVRSALVGVLERLTDAQGPGHADGRAHVAGYPGSADSDRPWTLLVGHDGIFKLVVLSVLGLPLEAFWAFPFALCGISILELRAGRGILRAHNVTGHLAPLETAAGLPPAAAVETSEERSGAL